jgi:hypothetical protein
MLKRIFGKISSIFESEDLRRSRELEAQSKKLRSRQDKKEKQLLKIWEVFNEAASSPEEKKKVVLDYLVQQSPDVVMLAKRFEIEGVDPRTTEPTPDNELLRTGFIDRPESISDGPATIKYHLFGK